MTGSGNQVLRKCKCETLFLSTFKVRHFTKQWIQRGHAETFSSVISNIIKMEEEQRHLRKPAFPTLSHFLKKNAYISVSLGYPEFLEMHEQPSRHAK